MKAVLVRQFGSYRQAEIAEVAVPQPGAGEVLVEVHAAPVNFVDLIVIAGQYQFKPDLPFTPGKGPAGIVRACGPGVDNLRAGDRVLAMAEIGGYAQQVVTSAAQCYRLPESMSFAQAAAMSLTFDTAWFALCERARLVPGETVLVLGATGGVGGAAVQLAKAKGARVLAAVSKSERAASVREMGADAIIDLSQGNLKESLRAQVQEATNGQGADIVLDPLGGEFFDAALRALAWCGRVVVIGFASGRIPSVKVNYLLVKNIEVSGLQISDYRKRRPSQLAACYRDLFSLFEAGRIVAPDHIEMPLADVAEALRRVEAREARGRIILVPPVCQEQET